jgi:hypothetical protein
MIGHREKSWVVDSQENRTISAVSMVRFIHVLNQYYCDVVVTAVVVSDDPTFALSFAALHTLSSSYAFFFEMPAHMHDVFLFIIAVRHGCLSLEDTAALYNYGRLESVCALFEGKVPIMKGVVDYRLRHGKRNITPPSVVASLLPNDEKKRTRRDWGDYDADGKIEVSLVKLIPQEIDATDVLEASDDQFASGFRHGFYTLKSVDPRKLRSFNSYVLSFSLYQPWIQCGYLGWTVFLDRERYRRFFGMKIRQLQFKGFLTRNFFSYIHNYLDDALGSYLKVGYNYDIMKVADFSSLRMHVIKESRSVQKKNNQNNIVPSDVYGVFSTEIDESDLQ